MISGFLGNGVMYGHQLGAVGKGRFDLDIGNHLRDTFHDIRPGQYPCAFRISSATVWPSRALSIIAQVISATASG